MRIREFFLRLLLMVFLSVPLISSSDTTMIFPIYALPTSTYAGSSTVVENSSENYSVSVQNGATYKWDVTGGTATIKNQNTLSVTWGTAGTGKLKLVITSSNGCKDSSEKQILINPLSGSNPFITVSDYDFGKKPVNAVINKAGGYVGEVTITNRTNQTIQLDSVVVWDKTFTCSNQFPITIGPKGTSKLTVRFMPIAYVAYSTSILVYVNSSFAGATLKGEGTTFPNGTSITEIELSADKLRVNPGEFVTIRMRVKSETPTIDVDPQEFTAYIEYDKSVLQWQQQYYVALMPGQMGQNTNVLKINTNRSKGNSFLVDMKFKALLGLTDSSKVIFSGKNAFTWADTNIKAYQALIDSVVYINVCQADSIRLLKQSVPAQIELLAPNPAESAVRLNYSILEEAITKIYIVNELGITKKVLLDDFTKSGNYELLFSTEDLTTGVYYILMQTPSEIYRKRMVVVK